MLKILAHDLRWRLVAALAHEDARGQNVAHRHQKQVGSTLFVNTGSVGQPKDGDPRAGYLIVIAGAQVAAALRRVGYNVAAALGPARALRRPAGDRRSVRAG